jgi:anti-anti-sigma factor
VWDHTVSTSLPFDSSTSRPTAPRPDGSVGQVRVEAGLVQVVGEIDLSNAWRLREVMQKAVEAVGAGFTVDLTGVDYLDSSALAVLWEFRDYRPRLMIATGSVVERVLDMVGLDHDTGGSDAAPTPPAER